MRRLAAFVALSLLAVACGAGAPAPERGERAPASTPSAGPTIRAKAPGVPFDPRKDGLEVGLAEWTVTLEAAAIRPGRVTFRIRNGGTRVHGFEIEAEGGDSSGHGSGDGLKAETNTLQPAQTTTLTLDLAAGVYKVECLVNGHDDLGMEALLEVRPDAPLVKAQPVAPNAVAIRGIAFRPSTVDVAPGTEVTWRNGDATAHTVTATDGAFDSGTVDQGERFAFAFRTSGTVTYFCKIHPDMRGSVRVG